jgi:hypothetical protein
MTWKPGCKECHSAESGTDLHVERSFLDHVPTVMWQLMQSSCANQVQDCSGISACFSIPIVAHEYARISSRETYSDPSMLAWRAYGPQSLLERQAVHFSKHLTQQDIYEYDFTTS